MTAIIIISVIAFLILAILNGISNTPMGKGFLGEKYVAKNLGKDKPGTRRTINNIYIKNKVGGTTQIDHVHINKNGIFVIETKNISGKIYGNEYSQEWKVYKGSYFKKRKRYTNEYNFYNPIKQNETHVYNIKQFINSNIPIYSIIVFTSIDADLSNVTASNVIYLHKLKQEIEKERNQKITSKDIENIYNKIASIKTNTKVTTTEHIKNIKNVKRNIKKNICPRCKGNLTERNGKYGKFLGCENYPKCKFTKNIK